jgi:hypothetical protein
MECNYAHAQRTPPETNMLEQERRYYDDHLQDWLQHFAGRFVLVKDATLIGTFDTLEAALAEGARRYGLQSFLVRRVEQPQGPVWIPALALGILNGDSQQPVQRPATTT